MMNHVAGTFGAARAGQSRPPTPCTLLVALGALLLLSGCTRLGWNTADRAPVEERGSPSTGAATVTSVRATPAVETPVRTPDATTYARPGQFGSEAAPQALAPPSGVAGAQSGPGVPPGAIPPPAAAPALALRPALQPPPGPSAVVPEPPINPAARTLVEQGRSWQGQGEFEKAAASFERALEIAPDDAWLWHRLASVRAAQGQSALARALARRSNALGSGDQALQQANAPLL